MAAQKIKWWLIYGIARSGSTLMMQLAGQNAKRMIGDWDLQLSTLVKSEEFEHVRFDRKRAYRDISKNLLDNAYPGGGKEIDLVYKQVHLDIKEYKKLVEMWGEPERKICCMREPSGYLASARKKFAIATLDDLRMSYNSFFRRLSFEKIGGEVFEYKPNLSVKDYKRFLKPLKLKDFNFEFKGEKNFDETNLLMHREYHEFRKRNKKHFFNF